MTLPPNRSIPRSSPRACNPFWLLALVTLMALVTLLAASSPRAAHAATGAKPARKPAAAALPASDSLPPALVHQLRKIRALSANFREEKRMAILVAPIVREGILHYEAPGRLAQQVTKPSPSRLVLSGNQLTMSDGEQRQVIDIDQQPAVGLLVRLLLGVLAGDVASLQRHARLTFTPPTRSSGWTLALQPQDPLLEKLIRHMQLTGHDAVIDVLTITDTGGDVTVTRFSNVKFAPGFTAQERAVRFGASP